MRIRERVLFGALALTSFALTGLGMYYSVVEPFPFIGVPLLFGSGGCFALSCSQVIKEEESYIECRSRKRNNEMQEHIALQMEPEISLSESREDVGVIDDTIFKLQLGIRLLKDRVREIDKADSVTKKILEKEMKEEKRMIYQQIQERKQLINDRRQIYTINGIGNDISPELEEEIPFSERIHGERQNNNLLSNQRF
jgi:ATP-dependent protease HslVU (ClpYQ) peptidase subunit